MKYYLLGLATLVAVCVGCAGRGPGGSGLSAMDEECYEEGGFGRRGGSPIVQASYRRTGQDYIAPPASMMMHPGPMVDGPGPGVLNGLAMAPGRNFATSSSEVLFAGPMGMSVGWQIQGGFADSQVVAPGKYSFRQGATYRLKINNIPERPGVVLYPTLQVYPAHPETDAFLSHCALPVQLTEEDLDQITNNNFVTKVIYLPNAAHQELAIAGVETLVSTKLDPGVDPVAEADRRGTIMAVIRCGNKDMEAVVAAEMGGGDGVTPASAIRQVDGEKGESAAPMAITDVDGGSAIPPAMMMAGPGGPGMPGVHPYMAGNAPQYGMPTTGTPIGLPGPPHLPYGGPASLRSHTVRNMTKQRIPRPVKHALIDVRHRPGINLPAPVSHVQYEENHPTFSE